MTTAVRRPALLRRTLLANAAFSGLSGLLLLAAGQRMALVIGAHTPTVRWVLGLGLVVFAAYVALTARSALLDVPAASLIAIGDTLWVVGSILIVLFGPLTTSGSAVVAGVALVVLAFAALQYYAFGRAVPLDRSRLAVRLRTWARRLLVGFGVSIALLVLLGAIDEAIQDRIATRRYPPPGRLVDVGGYRLHITCMGAGDPAVVIDAGAGNWSVSWIGIQRQLAGDTRVCTFDRAGLGWSDPSPRSRTSAVMADELHTLLHNAGVLPPFVLVGHSLGGYNARMFADRYSDEVAALVLVESAHERQWDRLPMEVMDLAKRGATQLRIASVMARIGLLHWVVLPDPHVARVAPELQGPFRTALTEPKVYDAWRAEVSSAFESAAEVAHTKSLGGIPVVVVSAGHSFDAFRQSGADIPYEQANAIWMQLQHELAQLSVNGVQLISPTSTHDINFDDPAMVMNGIRYACTHNYRWGGHQVPPSPVGIPTRNPREATHASVRVTLARGDPDAS